MAGNVMIFPSEREETPGESDVTLGRRKPQNWKNLDWSPVAAGDAVILPDNNNHVRTDCYVTPPAPAEWMTCPTLLVTITQHKWGFTGIPDEFDLALWNCSFKVQAVTFLSSVSPRPNIPHLSVLPE